MRLATLFLATALIVAAQTNARWALNNWLLMMYIYHPQAYSQLRADGWQWWNCVEWDTNGQAQPSTACEGPAPPDVAE